MPLNETPPIDAVHCPPDPGPCILTLHDPWDWSDRRSHLEALLSKLWVYLDAIDSGNLALRFPVTSGREHIIEVEALHPLPDFDRDFLGELEEICALYRVKIRYRLPTPPL